LLSPEELAAMVGLKPTAIAGWRSARKGPRYLRVGRKPWYPRDFVDVWMGAQIKETENVTQKSTRGLALPVHLRPERTKRNHAFGRHRTKQDGSPPVRRLAGQNHVSGARVTVNEDFLGVEAKRGRQAHRLAAAIGENFSFLSHDQSLLSEDIYHDIQQGSERQAVETWVAVAADFEKHNVCCAIRLEGRMRCGAQCSAHRFLHERADLRLFGGSQLLQREGGRPHGAFVEVRLVHEAECRVPRLESLRALEEADDLAVFGIRGHPVPESRREGWRVGFEDGMEPLA